VRRGSDEESSDPSATGRHHADYSIDRLAYRNRDRPFRDRYSLGADPMTAPLKQPYQRQPLTAADLLGRLDKVKPTGKDRYMACCPAHQDKSPSLSVRFDTTDGRVLMHCFAGCEISDICAAIGLEVADLYPRTDRPHYAGLPDWKRRRLEDAMSHLKLLILMFENAQKAGQALTDTDQADYQQAVARVAKINEVLRNG
jgi:hypothetical protein